MTVIHPADLDPGTLGVGESDVPVPEHEAEILADEGSRLGAAAVHAPGETTPFARTVIEYEGWESPEEAEDGVLHF